MSTVAFGGLLRAWAPGGEFDQPHTFSYAPSRAALTIPRRTSLRARFRPRSYRTLVGAALVASLTLVPHLALQAQDRPLLLEAHVGASIPVGSFADGDRTGEGASPGASLRVAFALPRADGARTFYLGFSQHRFGCEDASCGEDGGYVATGFDLGIRLAPWTEHTVIPWIRLGAITTRVEVDDLPPPDDGLSDLGFGGEAGVGAYIGRDWAVALNPAVTFAAINSELPGGETLRLRYLTATLGIVFAF